MRCGFARYLLMAGLVETGFGQIPFSGALSAEQYHREALASNASGDAAAAGVWIRKAWEQNPSEPAYVHDLAVYYIHRHDYPQGLEVIRDFVKRAGPSALAWTLQGELLFERGQMEPAFESLQSALAMSNVNYRAHELLGLIFSVHRRYALGLQEMKVAVDQNPNSAQLRFYCGRLNYQTANYLEARNQFQACLKLQPYYPQARENLGLAYEALSDPDDALVQYKEAVSLDRTQKIAPSDFPYVCLAVLIAKEEPTDEARALLQEGLARNPNSAWANFELGRLHFRAGRDQLAQRYLIRSSELDEKYSRPHFFLAKIYQRGNRSNDAKTEFEMFQHLDKDADNRVPQITR